MRVEVFSGDGKTRLGLGTLIGYVDVFAFYTPEGDLRSLTDAEQIIPEEVIHVFESIGLYYTEISCNPKIEMDDGTIKYGCQVWWRPTDQEKEK